MPLANIQLGELVFGGVGAGLYAMLIYVILSVFIAGLMVGRTPEYLGKKIESREIKLSMLYVLIFPLLILYYAGWSLVAPYGLSSLNNAGPHGLSEILYAYSSAAEQQWFSFRRPERQHALVQREPRHNDARGTFLDDRARHGDSRLVGRKKSVPESLGTFPTNGSLFVVLLVGVIIIVGALTLFPALSSAPSWSTSWLWSGKVY